LQIVPVPALVAEFSPKDGAVVVIADPLELMKSAPPLP
jgi:hypothetical protein